MISHATLQSYFDDVYRVQRAMRDSSVYYHRRSLQVFVDWLWYDPPIGQVDDTMVSAFVRDMAASYAPKTIQRMRANVLSTVRHAARAGLAQMPLQPRTVRVPQPVPEAWTIGQVRKLLSACGLVAHGLYLRGCIQAIWDTGLRYADVRRIDMERIDNAGRGTIRQNKTTKPLQIHLRAPTVATLTEIGGVKPLKYCRARSTYRWWRTLCQVAGVPDGGPQKLRRSAATELERTQPGTATSFLGHRSADLARRHYLDPRILNREHPQPPELG